MGHVITRCPKCSTTFRVTQAQLGVAKGFVRCGFCLSVFKAADQTDRPASNKKVASKQVGSNQIDSKRVDSKQIDSKQIASDQINRLKKEDATGQPVLQSTDNLQRKTATIPQKITKEPVFHMAENSQAENDETVSSPKVTHGKGNLLSTIQPAPVEMVWRDDKSKGRLWLWSFGIVLLLFIAVLQIAAFKFHTLSKVYPYRTVYNMVCPVLGCVLPALVDSSKIQVSNLVLRSHPSIDNALIVDTVLLNSADFSQPYPDLLLEFNDINDKKVAYRQFYVDEYLGGELAGSKLMPPNQPVQISIEIVDPGSEAVNYQLYVAPPTNRG